MGPAAYERSASDDEIATMCRIVDESIAGGAIGFATKTRPSTRPSPSQYASSKETESLLRVLSNRNQGVAMFNPGGAYDLERVYATQHDNGRPFTWIALMAMPDGSHRAQLELHNAWTARGARVHPQVSCRPLVAQCTLALPSIFRAPCLTTLAGSSVADRLAAYRSPAWRQEFRRGQEWLVAARGDPWRDLIVISSVSNASFVGRSIAAIAADENSDPVDVLFDLAVDDGLVTTVQLTYGNGDEYEVSQLLGVEGAVLGLSDGGAHPAQSCDAVLPTDLLGPWVRDRKALTLERAVHKLTAEPAALLGFAHRGLIRIGAFADLVVFDPRTIGPGPVRMIGDLPGGGERLVADRPTGIDHVLVNGVAIRADGKTVESENASGRVLRSGE
jgi:N-acyl-D-aspartate/D-glutamate deacylase